jgi:hypothetical protein
VTTAQSGKVVYLESDWNDKNNETGFDLPGLKFGETTLTDIRRRFGSNGFEFKERGGVIDVPDGIVMLNSYEVGANVVTFFTKVSEADYTKAKSAGEKWDVADHARLVSVSVASAEYAQSEWGKRIYDPGYKAVTWK